MINFDNYTNENRTKHNKNWPYIPDIQNFNNWRLRSWKNKFVIKFNRKSTRH